MTEERSLTESIDASELPAARINDRIAKFLNLLSEQKNERFRSSQTFFEPFFVDEDAIRRFHDVSKECLAKFDSVSATNFVARVRFSSNLEERRDNFDEFLISSTDEDEPEAVFLEWSVFFITHDGLPRSAAISISLVTERQLSTQEVGLHEVNRASMSLEVAGSDNGWVRESFRRIVPLLSGKSLRGVYRPLWIFRSQFFNGVAAQLIGVMGLFIGINFYGRHVNTEKLTSKTEMVRRISQETDIHEKINLLSAAILTPALDPWWSIILMIGSGAVTYGILWTLFGWVLPKLAPPSIIAFGSSAEKSKRRFGFYNAIVFSVIGGVILAPLVQSLVF